MRHLRNGARLCRARVVSNRAGVSGGFDVILVSGAGYWMIKRLVTRGGPCA
jgi:hypothetical protein